MNVHTVAARGALAEARTIERRQPPAHGFATLTSRGPLRGLSRELVDAQARKLVVALVDAVAGGGVAGPRVES